VSGCRARGKHASRLGAKTPGQAAKGGAGRRLSTAHPVLGPALACAHAPGVLVTAVVAPAPPSYPCPPKAARLSTCCEVAAAMMLAVGHGGPSLNYLRGPLRVLTPPI
jgi:hypothetical protein